LQRNTYARCGASGYFDTRGGFLKSVLGGHNFILSRVKILESELPVYTRNGRVIRTCVHVVRDDLRFRDWLPGGRFASHAIDKAKLLPKCRNCQHT
jgi:hypothetical protein